VTAKGDTIWHGKLIPYLVPTASFIKYMNEKHIKRVIDAGIDAIYLEEPEFWARAGYSSAFKEEWQKYYGFPWRAPHESPENTYLSNKLKYQLYYNALNKVFTFAKALYPLYARILRNLFFRPMRMIILWISSNNCTNKRPGPWFSRITSC
jgi:hypothetical protein